jgi:signal transduction histidine kinase
MPEARGLARRFAVLLPQSLLGRILLVLVAGVLAIQVAGTLVWTAQLRARDRAEVQAAARYVAEGAANTIRFFRAVPADYRPLLLQQFREMGGTRFFVSLGNGEVPVVPIARAELASVATDAATSALHAELPELSQLHVAFAWPGTLAVSPQGARITDLPESWVRHILLVGTERAPVLVLQTELEPGHWLYLATHMPNPYFLEGANPLAGNRIAIEGASLAAVLLIATLVVRRWITRPLAALSDAAEAFGTDEGAPELPRTGSREFLRTSHAFSAMRDRIRRYMEDRERLFISISHDLRTPITRLQLRSELLDDEALRNDFQEDLAELDMMVKEALQSVKDSAIHEDEADVRIDTLVQRLVAGARLAGHEVTWTESGLVVRAKPLALKRALGNLVDNALFYGERVSLGARTEDGWTSIEVRDRGPGVPEEALATLFAPRVRLAHGRERNEGGLGLGLGIARSIAQAQGGDLVVRNHPEGGFSAVIRLPAG